MYPDDAFEDTELDVDDDHVQQEQTYQPVVEENRQSAQDIRDLDDDDDDDDDGDDDEVDANDAAAAAAAGDLASLGDFIDIRPCVALFVSLVFVSTATQHPHVFLVRPHFVVRIHVVAPPLLLVVVHDDDDDDDLDDDDDDDDGVCSGFG
eukprot:CAMPEP_0167808758 /NCGR_PEP_ID=MMETSP0111_2-20121227/23387_1 /TAXON_ID=91324 /ORGANISM="Lotharella globosa, Strain CCCM811" /LENGTH=149 /DNA_ID=CAMNT_0007707009 /DNA_START=712 /DNA_END=1163 /DNA_ORIENTATION=-